MVEKKTKICVLGSASGDIFMKLSQMPKLGETVNSKGLTRAFGGKGANQAIQIGQLDSVQISFIGQLGNDETGKGYLELFKQKNVNVDNVRLLDGVETGQAYIISLDSGDNSIIIEGGANTHYPETGLVEFPEEWRKEISESQILLLQREIPEIVNTQAARVAKELGTKVVLDMGGRTDFLTEDLISLCDVINPNETELERIIHTQVQDFSDLENGELRQEAEKLLNKFPSLTLVVKLGEKGSVSYVKQGEAVEVTYVPALKFSDFPELRLVDVTAAGDCFIGAFCTKLVEEDFQMAQALQFANEIGFLCITKFGAVPSIHTLEEWRTILRK